MDRRCCETDGLHIRKTLFLGGTPPMVVTDSYELHAQPIREGGYTTLTSLFSASTPPATCRLPAGRPLIRDAGRSGGSQKYLSGARWRALSRPRPPRSSPAGR